jgi:eukaryotic-like serine/threonine-protein kinase
MLSGDTLIDPLVGQKLGPYMLTERIGAGGMGAVYCATHEVLDQPRAVKILPHGLGADPAFVERFVREARTAARLRHPNIVQVHDVGADNGIHYLVMELVEGRSLQAVLRDVRLLPTARVIGLLRQLATALDAAHALGIVHRDVKPSMSSSARAIISRWLISASPGPLRGAA